MQTKELRDPTLSLLCSKDYRIRPLRVRGRLLDVLTPYAHEVPAQAYAMIDRALVDNSVSFLQSPLVRSAARLALSGVTETEKLRALTSLPIQDFEQGDSEIIRWLQERSYNHCRPCGM